MSIPPAPIEYFCGKRATSDLRSMFPRPWPNSYQRWSDQSSMVCAKPPMSAFFDTSSLGKRKLVLMPLPMAFSESRIIFFCLGLMLHFSIAPGSSSMVKANIVPNSISPFGEAKLLLRAASAPMAFWANKYIVEAQICWKKWRLFPTHCCISMRRGCSGSLRRWMCISVPSPKKPSNKPAVTFASSASPGRPSGSLPSAVLLKNTLRKATPTSVPKRVAFLCWYARTESANSFTMSAPFAKKWPAM
mmetsp:Transcript_129496/g.253590  ORF Transcript_129496/g.253590 Transcript_129496/m.253590 type:complete len:246 (+) Transcript_129496:259-996(+)